MSYDNLRWIHGDHQQLDDICTPEEIECAKSSRKPLGQLFTIVTKQGERNEEAFRNYPRWQAYFEWMKNHPEKLLSPSADDYIEEFLALEKAEDA